MTLTRRGKVLRILVIVAVVLVAVPLVAGYAYLRSIGVYGESRPGRRVELRIPKGATGPAIGELLAENGVIESPLAFRIATYLREGEEEFQAGRYELFAGMTAPDALELLLEGALGERFVTVTFPEGSWLTDFAEILDRETHIAGDEFLRVLESGEITASVKPPDVETFEGLLFPSTYQIIKRDTARSVAQRLVDKFQEELERIDFEAKMQQLGYSAYEGVTVASMVEGEAKIADERAKVARVIYNRLEQGIALGIDATISYGLGEHKEVLTESDLAVDTPYNTRLHAGLPPTPIGASGTAALEAAADPAPGDWLYYVLADCEGHHAFSVSYDEFLQNKDAYQALDC